MKNINKLLFLIIVLGLSVNAVHAQKYQTREGVLQFNPNKTKSTDYEGKSASATAVFDVANNSVAVLVPVKTFHFGNALFEEHVNENYLESNKYPNITFKGKLNGLQPTMLKKDDSYTLSVSGEVEIHGVKKAFHSSALILDVKNNTATFKIDFTINYSDFNIEVPTTGKDKILNQVPVKALIKFNL